jgi:hypothetical protein
MPKDQDGFPVPSATDVNVKKFYTVLLKAKSFMLITEKGY